MAAKAKAKKKWTAQELVGLVRNHYQRRGYEHVIVEELGNATGYAHRSRIDAAVFNLWPSKGLWRAAIEIKVSRADFLHELSQPAKNEWAREFFHEFWFVAPADVIKEEELPEGTGWMKPRGKGLSVVRHAARSKDAKLNDLFFSACMRAMFKEKDERSYRFRKKLVEEDSGYQEAMNFQRACHRFLSERNCSTWVKDEDEILARLREATAEKGASEDLQRALDSLGSFRKKMFDLFEAVAVLGHVSLTERDEAGEAIVQYLSCDDARSLAAQRARARSRNGYKPITQKAKSYVQVRELMKAFFEKIMGGGGNADG